MQHILNVIEPAPSVALLTLDEARIALQIAATEHLYDDAILQLIDYVSDSLATMVNRTFVKEKVEEDFYDINPAVPSIFFSRWPVKFEDIEEFSTGGINLLSAYDSWVLEQKTGTLYRPPRGGWAGNVHAIYSGGYILPDEAPPALKQLCTLALRELYTQMMMAGGGIMAGNVRMIAHKSSRIMYHAEGVKEGSTKTSLPVSGVVGRVINDVLTHYFRHWL